MDRQWQERGIPWLREQLARREWRPADLSRKMDVPHGTISRWLSAALTPSSEMCARLANTFGVDPDEVLTLAGHRPAVHQEDDPTIRETVALMRQLPPAQREEVVAYARFRRDRVQARSRRNDSVAVQQGMG